MTGKRGPGGFPGPVCELDDGTLLWRWPEVAQWLWENDMSQEVVLRDAREVEAINTALEVVRQKHADGQLADEVMRAIARAP